MKTVSAFLLFMSVMGWKPAFSVGLTSSVSTSDSVPSQRTTRFFELKYQPRAVSVSHKPGLPLSRFSTTIKNQPGTGSIKNGEISLPLGIIEKSIVVEVGNTTLQADKDYTYLVSGNRLRITDPRILQPEDSIEITYETMRFQHQR